MKNWRTTLAGSVLAVCVAIEPFVTTGEFELKRILFAGGIALVSTLAKDAGVTGTKK
jgi:hypothetical protein